MAVDGGLRGLFRDNLRVGWHWQSIETGGTGRGVPDSNFCAAEKRDGRVVGTEGWIEFKQTEGWTADLRPEQISWLLERSARGGRCFVAVRRKNQGGPRRGAPVDELWLYPGRLARRLRLEGLRLEDGLLYRGEGGPSNWNWVRIAEVLTT